MIQNDNYVTIQGWMVNDLKLKGNDLIVYAIIYMFSQTEEQKFAGSLQYLASWLSMSKQGVQKILKSLLNRNLIIKNDVYRNNVKFCEYCTTVVDELGRHYTTEVDEVYNHSLRGIQPQLTNIKEEIKDKIKEKENIKEKFDKFWEAYPKHQVKQNTIKWFEKNNPSNELMDTILNKLEIFKQTRQWQNTQYVPMPTTWLNQKRWEDEIPECDLVEIDEYANETEEEWMERLQKEYEDEKRRGLR